MHYYINEKYVNLKCFSSMLLLGITNDYVSLTHNHCAIRVKEGFKPIKISASLNSSLAVINKKYVTVVVSDEVFNCSFKCIKSMINKL